VVHRKELRNHLTNLLSHLRNTPIVKTDIEEEAKAVNTDAE